MLTHESHIGSVLVFTLAAIIQDKQYSKAVTMDALFGHTGFVGSFLKENLPHRTTAYFSSKNVRSAKGKSYRNVYCACISATKWWANTNPGEDLKNIEAALSVLTSIKCQSITLISTIDVHDHGHPLQDEGCQFPSDEPYGRNRLHAENVLHEAFGDRLIVVRLPALFGVGLKKNVLFDLLNNNLVGNINSNSAYQWYPLHWLWTDINRAKDEFFTGHLDEKRVVNLYPMPIDTIDIINMFFPEKAETVKFGDRVSYNQGSRYNNMFAYKQGVILAEMERFIKTYKMFWARDIDNLVDNGDATNNRLQRLVISNMAWDPVDDNHAIFLLKRYGIKNVEIIPTKYYSWDTLFNNPTFHEKFNKAGINIHSLQSVLHGVKGDFFNDPDIMAEHLKKVLDLCTFVGANVAVMGSPSKRVVPKTVSRESAEAYEKKLGDVLDTAQIGSGGEGEGKPILCLEPNAVAYGCEVGRTLDACARISKDRSFGLNFDTGNYHLENDSTGLIDGIRHCQVSAPMLRPMRVSDYVSIRNSMTGYHLKNLDGDVKVSMEAKIRKIDTLGEHIRRFVTYMAEYL